MIDLIIQENEKLPENQKWPKSEIVANISLFQVTGADTTVNSTNTFMYYLASQAKLQDKIRSIVKNFQKEKTGDINIQELCASDKYSSFIKEILRLFGPILITTIRTVTKTSKLGKYKIRKGDRIFAPCALKHIDP